MEFTEKLARLTAEQNKSQIARDAGLSPTAISDYLQKGYIPRADNALALARALKVPLDWLVDPSRDWPPPSLTAPSTAQLSDDELMTEVARRYRNQALRMRGMIETLQKA